MNPVPIIRGPYRRPSGRPPTHKVRGVERRWRAGKLDGRRKETKQIEALADDFAADAGGWENLTSREIALVHTAAFSAWVCQQTAGWALTRDDGVIKADGTVPAVLGKTFVAYANTLSRTLERLGLRPDRVKEQSLDDYLRARTNGSGAAQNAATPHATTPTDAPASTSADAPVSDETQLSNQPTEV